MNSLSPLLLYFFNDHTCQKIIARTSRIVLLLNAYIAPHQTWAEAFSMLNAQAQAFTHYEL